MRIVQFLVVAILFFLLGGMTVYLSMARRGPPPRIPTAVDPPPVVAGAAPPLAPRVKKKDEPDPDNRTIEKQPRRPETSFHEILATYEAVLAGEASGEDLSRVVRQLSGIDLTPEKKELLLAILEKPDLDFPHRASALARALGQHVDDRIYAAARHNIEYYASQGLESWTHTHGYLELIARRESRESSEFLLEQLASGNGQTVTKASQLLEHLEGHVPPEKILASADPLMMAHAGYRSLARWEDPTVDALLEKTAFEEGHAEAYVALAGSVSPARLRPLLDPYYDGDEKKRKAVLEALVQLRKNRKLTDEDRGREGLPILRDAIVQPEAPGWSSALYAIEHDPAFHTPEIARLLESLADDPSTEARQRKRVKSTLWEVRKTLGRED